MESPRILIQKLHDSMESSRKLSMSQQDYLTNEPSTPPTCLTASITSSPGESTSALPLSTLEMLLQQNSIQFGTLQKKVNELQALLQTLEDKVKLKLALIQKPMDRMNSRHSGIQMLKDSKKPLLASV
jgi:hypothetical protein